MRLPRRRRRDTLSAAASIARRYDRILLATLVVVLVMAAALLVVDHRDEERTEQEHLASRVFDRLDELNALVHGAVDAVDALRVHAEGVVAGSGSALATRHQLLRGKPGGPLTLDDAPPGPGGRGHGNVIVPSGPAGPTSWLETRVALALGETFADNAQAAPFLAWQTFVSAGGTVAVFPWISSRLYPLDPDPRGRGVFSAGTPERDPGRHNFWIDPEQDAAGKGPVGGVGAPVYAEDRLLGTVAALVQAESLDEIAERLRYPLGRLLVLDQANRVLAMAGNVPNGSRTFPLGRLEDIAPEAGNPAVADAISQPTGAWRRAGGQLILAAELGQAPWRLVFVMSRWELARTIAARSVGQLLRHRAPRRRARRPRRRAPEPAPRIRAGRRRRLRRRHPQTRRRHLPGRALAMRYEERLGLVDVDRTLEPRVQPTARRATAGASRHRGEVFSSPIRGRCGRARGRPSGGRRSGGPGRPTS